VCIVRQHGGINVIKEGGFKKNEAREREKSCRRQARHAADNCAKWREKYLRLTPAGRC